MRLYRFEAGEIDWVAAESLEQANDIYRRHYGLSDAEVASVEASEVDPSSVEVYPDDWDYEDDEAEPPTAAEFMTKPGLVCSTCQ